MSQVVFITGGASGLGKTLALTWAARGASVCIGDVNLERGEQTLQELIAAGADALFVKCDITSEADLQDAFDAIMQRWQRIDVVVNNAGIASAGRLESESIEQWQKVLDINLLGMVRCSKQFVGAFKQQGHGYFVNVASQAGLTPIPRMGSYNAVKSAVVAFSETMKLELARDNIGVTVVCPTFFKTNLAESLQTTEPVLHQQVQKYLNRAELTAQQVADAILDGVDKGRFLLTPDKIGKLAYWLKCFMPENWYFKRMLKQSRRMMEK
ncbi:SDR family oxidoreductase [Neptunicella marina]|uniref:SDR family oxidoreductase n=1 Tax=Neptunicella marina TaxID=2125989 RepID=A0A8J6IY27_9ALTE|nr:SDR family oxidoreductase [Neptunicella marina]MBC3767426.1 SDR family oxidoreductase [Neptunicella marina]